MRVIGYAKGSEIATVKSYLETKHANDSTELITDSGDFNVGTSTGYMRLLDIIWGKQAGMVVFSSENALPRGEEARQSLRDMCGSRGILLSFVDKELAAEKAEAESKKTENLEEIRIAI